MQMKNLQEEVIIGGLQQTNEKYLIIIFYFSPPRINTIAEIKGFLIDRLLQSASLYLF